ncbi:glutaredoxin family protein [Caldimonas brevitalea]|uniref:Glutaredoxin domain-containing protein n=1 Tax=Caldimonas brevitalea TaxID=413882 RepID=A0A0G3BRB2_9BURK|nr:glutaredoxin family protein [Caldimonas brevitalea]AKJ30528.1 hypothetical protein AAW51_3837 [Caldimonas brevitalea]
MRRFASLGLFAALVLAAVGLAQHWQERATVQVLTQQARPGDIVMYTTTECPYCAQARRWMTQRDVPYTECNISVSPACQQAYEQLRAVGVPTLVVKGQRQTGFDAERVARAVAR